MRTTLSPLTIIVPSFLMFSGVVLSSVSSSTRFRCWSNPLSLPRRLFPPFSLTSTIFVRFCSRISVVISLMFGWHLWLYLSEFNVYGYTFKPISEPFCACLGFG